jgi:hypothetical protein
VTWATFTDITSRWVGSNAPTDENLVDALIGDAEQIILSHYPAIQTRIDEDLLPVERVVMVVSSMVTRVLRNPDGLSMWQQTTGPFGQMRQFADAGSGLHITDDEIRLLAPSRGGKAFEVDLGTEASVYPDGVVWPDA